MERKTITISSLGLRHGQAGQGVKTDIAGLRIERLAPPDPAFHYFMDRAVGREWFWMERDDRSERKWKNHGRRDSVQG